MLLILGGNGFVRSHICKEALDRGLSVASLSRSGKSSIQESWANKVDWRKGDLLSGDSWKEALDGVTFVISCVGGFGSNATCTRSMELQILMLLELQLNTQISVGRSGFLLPYP